MSLRKESLSKWIFSIALPPIAFLSLLDYFFILENQGLSTTFLNLLDNTTLRNYLIGLVASFLLYFFLAIYLDNVLPQGSNLHKKWYYPITDLFRCCRSNRRSSNSNMGGNSMRNYYNPFIQKDPEGLKKSVEVNHIRRNFSVKGETLEILKDIHFNAYYDEIFAILGHNGAGKTTLLQIMTGILSSTHGEVYYDNVPIQGNETEICKQFGYCPQFDSFNNSLTVKEHVQLFAGIKGIKVNVNDVLTDVDLYNKRNDYPNELSGGQKRKLGITLALLGSPKFVFLDEPTTGLDPYSRKSIWELLLRKKNGCTLFITTHYMDEADLLADRKMIISNGSITCLGTSLFLKNSFNMNYALDINTTNPMDNYYTDHIIDRYCPGSSKTRNITVSQCNDEKSPNSRVIDSRVYIITYLLPMRYSYYFKNILNALNKMIKDPDNGLSNFSLTSPTLEELFIKLESNKGGRDNTLNGKIQKMENPSAVDINGGGGSKNGRRSEWNGNNDSERL
eukprot:jgi/Orpsp1_1/1191193/evm.model.d7180000084066.1